MSATNNQIDVLAVLDACRVELAAALKSDDMTFERIDSHHSMRRFDAARTAVAALLAERDALAAEVKALQATLKAVRGWVEEVAVMNEQHPLCLPDEYTDEEVDDEGGDAGHVTITARLLRGILKEIDVRQSAPGEQA